MLYRNQTVILPSTPSSFADEISENRKARPKRGRTSMRRETSQHPAVACEKLERADTENRITGKSAARSYFGKQIHIKSVTYCGLGAVSSSQSTSARTTGTSNYSSARSGRK